MLKIGLKQSNIDFCTNINHGYSHGLEGVRFFMPKKSVFPYISTFLYKNTKLKFIFVKIYLKTIAIILIML